MKNVQNLVRIFCAIVCITLIAGCKKDNPEPTLEYLPIAVKQDAYAVNALVFNQTSNRLFIVHADKISMHDYADGARTVRPIPSRDPAVIANPQWEADWIVWHKPGMPEYHAVTKAELDTKNALLVVQRYAKQYGSPQFIPVTPEITANGYKIIYTELSYQAGTNPQLVSPSYTYFFNQGVSNGVRVKVYYLTE